MQQTKKFKMADAISPYLAVSCGLITAQRHIGMSALAILHFDNIIIKDHKTYISIAIALH